MKNLAIIFTLFFAMTLACKLPASLSGSNSGSSASNAGSRGTKSESVATAGKDPKSDIIQASTKFAEAPFFTAQMDGTGPSELHIKLEYVAPDRYHMTHTAGASAGMEIIIIGKQTFIKTAGRWLKSPVDMGSSIPTLRDQFTEEGLKRLTDIKFDGDDTVDGKPALAYSYASTTPIDNSSYKSKIWVSKASGIPLRITVDYENGKLKQMTVNYDTETPVLIEQPISK